MVIFLEIFKEVLPFDYDWRPNTALSAVDSVGQLLQRIEIEVSGRPVVS